MKTENDLQPSNESEGSQLLQVTGASKPRERMSESRLAFTVEEAALMLGISQKSIRRLIARGLLRASKALRRLIIPKKELEKFLERTTNE